MNIKISVALSPGVTKLVEKSENKFNLDHLDEMVRIAINLLHRSEFIVFHHEKIETVVTDGRANILALLPLWIPENIMIVQDDTDDDFAFLVLLPSEWN
ncbi:MULTISPECIES: hypothetical protein [Oceanobacillus]|uniref:hypothetical protein n=1 Tax=Oceanobacillus TaxID=182709 RepID=UPI0005958CC2|nr:MULTISPECIES: hypothetical protein [Oceanobacillus]